jgi:PAS domain S-box-containing protein
MYVRDGELGSMHWVDRAIRDADGAVVEIQGVGRDVSELRRIEEALRTRETQLRLAMDNALIGTWDWSIETGWIAWSERTGTLYGLPAHTTGVTLEAFLSLVHPDDRERVEEETRQRTADGADYAVEYRIFWPDGSLHWLERRGRAIAFDGEGRPLRFLGVTIDVTELKQSETTLRELSQRLMSSQDDERRRLARELHDGLAQDVFAMTMALASLENTVPPMEGGPPAALTASRRLAEQVLRGLRTRSYLLHPPLLDLSGLAAALREYADGLNKHGGLDIDTSAVEDVGRLPEDVETALFRVAQEALSNVARHAETNRAVLMVSRDETMVELCVADTGKGLAKGNGQKAPTIGVGIAGMRERLSQIGGRLDIRSGRDGTTVTARVPAPPGISSAVSQVP